MYVRLTPKGKKPPFRALLLTQLVSGVWHGLFPGYAMFFAGSAFMFESAKIIYRYEGSVGHAGLRSFAPWKAVKVLYSAICLNFLACAFLVSPCPVVQAYMCHSMRHAWWPERPCTTCREYAGRSCTRCDQQLGGIRWRACGCGS